MTENHWATFSGQQLASAYAIEADALGAIAMSPSFNGLIQHFSDYDGYLKSLLSDTNYLEGVRALVSPEGLVDTAIPTKELVLLFCQAQIAASAELFKGWKIPSDQLHREGMRLLIKKSTADIIDEPGIPGDIPPDQLGYAQKQILSGINVIQNADTVRVVQIIRLLGLLSTPAKEIHQLSLGVGNGYRDLYGIHIIPRVTLSEVMPSRSYCFDTSESQAAHTVLIDNDSAQKEHFYDLNVNARGRLLALNEDADVSLEQLRDMQKESLLEPRNLVVCLRIDHRMIPNPEDFIRLISRVIASEAELVMTIGAGHSLSEFKGRLKCFDDLFDLLAESGHKPVRILLHGGGSSEDKRGKPNFGQLAYASYEILHCKLHRDHLTEAL